VSDELWDRLEPLLPQRARRFRYPGRRALPDRAVLCGVLYVLHTGIQWECLPQELGPSSLALRTTSRPSTAGRSRRATEITGN
jgi:transposase